MGFAGGIVGEGVVVVVVSKLRTQSTKFSTAVATELGSKFPSKPLLLLQDFDSLFYVNTRYHHYPFSSSSRIVEWVYLFLSQFVLLKRCIPL